MTDEEFAANIRNGAQELVRFVESGSLEHAAIYVLDERVAAYALGLLTKRIAQYREIIRVVAEADNSDSSICYQLCNVRWYGGETEAEEMEMRHDAPCIVAKARALLAGEPAVPAAYSIVHPDGRPSERSFYVRQEHKRPQESESEVDPDATP